MYAALLLLLLATPPDIKWANSLTVDAMAVRGGDGEIHVLCAGYIGGWRSSIDQNGQEAWSETERVIHQIFFEIRTHGKMWEYPFWPNPNKNDLRKCEDLEWHARSSFPYCEDMRGKDLNLFCTEPRKEDKMYSPFAGSAP